MDSLALKKSELIRFYRYKRTFLYLDEWAFYMILIFMYIHSFPFLIVGTVLFYGSSALYTSYVNLDKLEKMIVPLDQNIYIFENKVGDMIRFLIQVKDYFSTSRQEPYRVQ
jgi:hypothetical protein